MYIHCQVVTDKWIELFLYICIKARRHFLLNIFPKDSIIHFFWKKYIFGENAKSSENS